MARIKLVSKFLLVVFAIAGMIFTFQNCSSTKFEDVSPSNVAGADSPNEDLHRDTEIPPSGSTATPGGAGSESNPINMVQKSSCARNAACDLQGKHFGQYRAEILTDKSVYKTGEMIRLNWDSFPAMKNNWITIVPADFEPNSWCTYFYNDSADQIYGSNAGTLNPDTRAGSVSGVAFFKAGEPGAYEIRGYYGWHDPGACEVIGRQTITIVE